MKSRIVFIVVIYLQLSLPGFAQTKLDTMMSAQAIQIQIQDKKISNIQVKLDTLNKNIQVIEKTTGAVKKHSLNIGQWVLTFLPIIIFLTGILAINKRLKEFKLTD